MQEPTGKHYMRAALKRQYADRVPVTILFGPFCARIAGFTIREILTDAKKCAEAHLAFYHRFTPDSLIVYSDIYNEAEALGCPLEFPDDDISHPKTILLEDKSKLVKLKPPDPKKDGRLPYYFEALERIRSGLKQSAPIGLGPSGPWNLAMHLRSAESLLIDTIQDPDFVHDLMKFTTAVVRSICDALLEAGFTPSFGEAYASCSLISPHIYREFIKPYHRELCEHFKAKKAFLSLHVCGLIDPIMEDISDSGISFLSLDAPSSLQKWLAVSAGRQAVMGNVRTTLFSEGTPVEMEAAIRDCIETAAEGSGYILCSGCEIPLNSTTDRIDHFFEYGRRFGREFMSKLQ